MLHNTLILILFVGALMSPALRLATADEPTPANEKEPPPVAGIGVALRVDDGNILIHKIVPKSPAEQSGLLKPGDRILAVGEGSALPKLVAGLRLEEVTGLIRGKRGTVVRLTVAPAGKPDADAKVISLPRGELKELNFFGQGKPLEAGAVAPDFEFTRLSDGEKNKLSALGGKIVVVEFWACWCKPCLEQVDRLPAIVEKHPEWAGKVVILAVSVDDERDDPAALAKRREWKGIEAVWSGPAPMKPYHATALPTRYVIDRHGKIAEAAREDELASVIDQLLKEKK